MRWLPDTLWARIAITSIGGLIFFQIASVTMLYIQGPLEGRRIGSLATKIATITEAVEAIRPDDRSAAVAALTLPALKVVLRATALPEIGEDHTPFAHALLREIDAELGEPRRSVILGTDPRGGEGGVVIEVALSDERWLLFAAPGTVAAKISLYPFAWRLAAFCVVIGIVSALVARRLGASIAQFADAAEGLNIDVDAPPLVERGPRELRAATRAFNRMQQRLRRFIADRTQMLAAMSHDLRTPLTRLRLRAEFVEDPEQQHKMLERDCFRLSRFGIPEGGHF